MTHEGPETKHPHPAGLAFDRALEAAGVSARRGRGEARADVVIVGGGLGACAAALAATRMGARVVMSEETGWIGGQVTQQGVPPDEHPWIEQFGCTQAYRRFRALVRDYYRRHYPLTADALRRPNLNPGNGAVSYICHEPRVALAALHSMLAPALGGGRLDLLLHHKAIDADVDGDRVRAVRVRDLRSGRDLVLSAPWFVDATEQGDLLHITNTEYVAGFESNRDTGEPSAPDEAQPQNIQAVTWCFAVDHLPGEDHTIERPADYAFWRDYTPELKPPWTGRLFSWTMPHPITLQPRDLTFDPTLAGDGDKFNLWLYRRIADRENFTPGAYRSDISLINYPQNDYWLGNLHGVPDDEAARHAAAARQLSLSFLHWMQTEAPRPDGGTGWKGLRLRHDVFDTDHGLAPFPYIRESRRILAEFTVAEQHVSLKARMEATGRSENEVQAERFADSVGVGYYRIDLHPSTGGDNYIDVGSLPYQIPLGALVPRRMENLLPGCKNLGVTHITNGCYRLHPTEWNVGEAAGALAAFCLQKKEPPRRVRNHPPLLKEFQDALVRDGVEIAWPDVGPR